MMIKTAMMIPAVVSGLWFANDTGSIAQAVNYADPAMRVSATASGLEAGGELDSAKLHSIEEEVVARRLRIERLLFTLDHVAQAAMQMAPERAAGLEPVIVDLAEQTMQLTTADAVMSDSTDGQLKKLEETVGTLVKAMNKMVEPELTL